jgi:GMP synthase-like glutamine amidotransferase
MKQIHCFQHAPYETPGLIEKWVVSHGFALSFTRFFDGQKPPDMHGVDWLVVMGGPMGVYDDAQYPWLAQEKKSIKEALSGGKVILGICLGAQLIADCLGALVRHNLYKEIGWFPIFLESAALDLPIAKVFPPQWEALHWHGDTFEIPDGARLLASSPACRNQGFIYGDRVVGLQFHPEMDRPTLEGLVRHCAADLVPDDYVQTPFDILADHAPFDGNRVLIDKILVYLNQLPPQ